MLAYALTPAVSEEELHTFESSQSSSLYLNRSQALEELKEALAESQEEDWDGDGAASASIEAYFAACRVLKSLPEWVLDPEVSFSPRGRVLLEWYLAPRRVLTLSIGETGEIASALLLGRSKRTGTDLFIDKIPNVVLADLQRLYQ